MDPISATLQLGGTFLQRHWQQKDYRTQRKDALADWNMQNEYNSPQRVMERYKAAGLNPNLIYGNGTMAQADQPRSSNIGSPPEMPKLNLMAGYQQAKQMQLQTDNLKVQNEILTQQATGIDLDNQTKEFELKKKKSSLPWDLKHIEYSAENQRKQGLVYDIDIKQRDVNYNQSLAWNILTNTEKQLDIAIKKVQTDWADKNYKQQYDKTAEEIENIKESRKVLKQQWQNLDLDQKIKNFEIELNKKGLTKTDDVKYRIVNNVVPKIVDAIITDPEGSKERIEKIFMMPAYGRMKLGNWISEGIRNYKPMSTYNKK